MNPCLGPVRSGVIPCPEHCRLECEFLIRTLYGLGFDSLPMDHTRVCLCESLPSQWGLGCETLSRTCRLGCESLPRTMQPCV